MRKVTLLPVLLVALATPIFPRAHGRLYNLKTGEVTTMNYTRGFWTGHGKIDAMLPTGEQLTGEWSIVRNGYTSWGSIYSSAYSGGSSAFGSASRMSTVSALSARGAGILAGPGHVIDCEFVASAGGHGSGACRDQDGTVYRLIY